MLYRPRPAKFAGRRGRAYIRDMATQKQFDDKRNWDDVFLRNVTAALIKHMHNRLHWVNRFSTGDVPVLVPFYFSMTGDEQFLMDTFTDDVAWKRVEMNTDIVPRGVVALKTVDTKDPEFSNPNVPILLNRLLSEHLQRVIVDVKPIPVKATYEAKIKVESELDVFKCWQQLMDMAWTYRYFDFTYAGMPVAAVVKLPSTIEDVVVREADFKVSTSIELAFSLEVHTYYPSLGWDDAQPAFPVDWIARVFEQRVPK